MGRQIELEDDLVRRIELAKKLSQSRGVETLEEYIARELKADSDRRIAFYADLEQVVTSIYDDPECMSNSEFVDEHIDQIERDVEAGEFD